MQARTLHEYTRLITGCLLLVFGFWGALYSARAALAQWLYFETKFGEREVEVDAVLRRSESAAKAYPYNFYMAQWSGSKALEAALRADNEKDCIRYLNAADYWSRQSLWLNPFRSDIQQLRCRGLEAEGKTGEAVEVWRTFVDREFWNPDHHAYLARLYMKAGMLEQAEESLQWAKRSRESREIQESLRLLKTPDSSRR